MEDNEYKITRTFSIQIKLWKRFRQLVKEKNLGVSEVIAMLIEQWLMK